MIVREVLKYPWILDNFDFFNDFADTIGFLRGLQTAEADELSQELTRRFDEWLENRYRANGGK